MSRLKIQYIPIQNVEYIIIISGVRDGFVGDAYTPANETANLVSLDMAAPVRSVSDMRYNPNTLNGSGDYIYNIISYRATLTHPLGQKKIQLCL